MTDAERVREIRERRLRAYTLEGGAFQLQQTWEDMDWLLSALDARERWIEELEKRNRDLMEAMPDDIR